MKKQWHMPNLEILDVKQTMGGLDDPANDGTMYNIKGDLVGPSHGSNMTHSKWTTVPI